MVTLHQLLLELHTPLRRSTLVYCDNINIVYMSSNPFNINEQSIKHIETDLYFFRERVASTSGDVFLSYMCLATFSQFADIFTKVLPSV
jgi:hypothetical protein